MDFFVTASKGATPWHAQAHINGLTFEHGRTYTITFRMKADKPRPANIRVCHQNPNWENYGLSRDFDVTTEERGYSFTFVAANPVPENARVTLILGGDTAKFTMQGFDIREGWPEEKLSANESLATAGIPVGFGTPARNLDWRRFLADTDRAFAEEMRNFLRDELGVKAPVCDTQIDYGRLVGFYREQNMDYADAHGYWQHPEFPGKPFDFNNWHIGNTPQIDEMAKDTPNGLNASMLQRLALYRVAGKPYIISEFDHPAPNDYAAEMLPTAAAFAAWQDWDGLVLFAMRENPAQNPRIDLWFDASAPNKFGFLPQAALIFRRPELFPSATSGKILALPQEIWLDENLHAPTTWADANDGRAPDVLKERVAVSDAFLPAASPLAVRLGDSRQAGNATLAIATENGGNIFSASSSTSAILAGRLKSAASGALTLANVTTDGGFVSASVVSMDSEPLAASGRILLTIAGRFENTEMKWNAERTSVANNWGRGPILAAGVTADVGLAVDAAPRKVFALNAAGQRNGEVPVKYADGRLTFTINPQQEAIWYEITR